jgi:hypothetical protein
MARTWSGFVPLNAITLQGWERLVEIHTWPDEVVSPASVESGEPVKETPHPPGEPVHIRNKFEENK